MYVRHRGDRWQGRVVIQGYPEQLKTFSSEAEAYAWGAQVTKQIQEGGYSAPARTTLQGALKRYQSEVSVHKKGAAQESSVITLLTAHRISALPLTKIRGADVAAYRDEMKAKGRAPATIARHLAVLSNLFNTARLEWSVEVANPVEMVKKPVIRNARSRRVTAEELEKLLAATDSHYLRVIVPLAIETCMRRSEIANLRWSDVDMKRRVVTLKDTKNGDARDVPLSSRAITLLQALPRRIDGWLFRMRGDSITQAFERACERAGLSDLRFHDLRHEGVSRLFELGLNPMEVAAISGHKTLQMLKRYTHLKAEDLARKLG